MRRFYQEVIATTIPTYQITIAQKIKEYRMQNDLSQRDFAKLIGVSTQAVYKWEKQICYPDIMLLPYLARILGCQTDAFFTLVFHSQLERENPSTNDSLTEHDNCDMLKTNPNGGDSKNE